MDKSNITNLFQQEITTHLLFFLGGNNLYNGTNDSEADIAIANDLVELANKFTTAAKYLSSEYPRVVKMLPELNP